MLELCKFTKIDQIIFNVIDKEISLISKQEWVQRFKENIKRNEENCWTATLYMYRSLENFRQCEININSGFKWWYVAKLNPSLLYKIKVMYKVLVINNERCGFQCNCSEASTILHILFDCEIVKNTRQRLWKDMIMSMLNPFKEIFEASSKTKQLELIYNALYLEIRQEYMVIFKAICNFVYLQVKSWYSNV